jgi:glutamine synthetase
VNLLDPQDEAHNNLQFMTYLCAVIRAVHTNADLLRAAISSASNDHRLGANEAPPAIISIFLGDMLEDLIDQIAKGSTSRTLKGGSLDLGARTLPELTRDSGDRNRTSPFAFIGNRFEFRAVGSSASVAWPNTVINTIVADSLDYIATQIEKSVKSSSTQAQTDAAIRKVLQQVIKDHRDIVFNGDNYTEEWQVEAEKRGLPNLKTTADTLPVFKKRSVASMFKKYKVLTKPELESRAEIFAEQYVTQIGIETHQMLSIARTQILPACLEYQRRIAQTMTQTEAAGSDASFLGSTLDLVTERVHRLVQAIEQLKSHVGFRNLDPFDASFYIRDHVLDAMKELRKASDALERMVDHDLWPLPAYSEMLTIR